MTGRPAGAAGFEAGGVAFRVRPLGAEAAVSGAASGGVDASDGDLAEVLLQSASWGIFKASTGWAARRFRIEGSGASGPSTGFRLDLLTLERRLRAGFTFAYVPHGPERFPPGIDPAEFLHALGACLKPHFGARCAFIRYDLPQEADAATDAAAIAADGRLARGSDVQVPDTVLLDLRPAEESLLAAMKPKWRYNIRLASKKGVTVSDEGAEACPVFYAIYRETAARDGIAIHPESYYSALFDAARGSDTRMGLWVARHEGEPIAAIITAFRREKAIYLYGASSGKKRSLMPAYALQWEAIRAARRAGCSEYDFFGIPPDDDPSHPMAGLYRFKTGFGGRIAHRAGSIDMSYIPWARAAFSAAERARLFWHKRVKKTALKAFARLAGRREKGGERSGEQGEKET